MRKALVIIGIVLLFLAACVMPLFAAEIPGIRISGPIVPTDTTDTYATHEAAYGKGGLRTVADSTAMDAIPAARRESGMMVWVESVRRLYSLSSDLTNWVEFAQSTSATNYASLASLPTSGLASNTVLKVLGFSTIGDGGGGDFVWKPGSTSTNLPNSPASGGAFERLDWDGYVGAFGADRTESNDSTAALQAAMNYASPLKIRLLLNGGNFKVTTNLIHVDNFQMHGPGALVGYYSAIKPYAIVRTTNSAFPTWADASHTIYATNAEVVGVTFKRASGYTGPLALFSGVRGLRVAQCNFTGTGHADWALTLGPVDFQVVDNFFDVGGAVFQDGIHVWWGRDGVIVGNQGVSGDDFIALVTYDNGITNVVVTGNQGRSTHAHMLRVNNDKYSASFPAPVNGIRNVLIDGLYGETGFPPRNGGIRIEDFNYGVYQFDPTNGPGRSIQNLTVKNVGVKTYGTTNGLGFAIEIMGGDRITLDNLTAQGPWSALACVGVSNFVMRNSWMQTPNVTNVSYPTVRFDGYIGGGSGAPLNNAYPNYNVTLENNRIEALRADIPGLSLRHMSNVTRIIGNEITTISGYNPIYLNTYDKLEVQNNYLRGGTNSGVLVFGLGNALTMLNNRYEGTGQEIQFVGSVTPTVHYSNLKAQYNEWQSPGTLRALSVYATNGIFNRIHLPTQSSNYVGSLYTDANGYSVFQATNGLIKFAENELTDDLTRSIRLVFQSPSNRLETLFALFSGSGSFDYYRMGYGSSLNVSPMWWSFGNAGTNNTAGLETFRLDWPTLTNRTAAQYTLGASTQLVHTITFTNAPAVGDTVTVNGLTGTWNTNTTATTIQTNSVIETASTTLYNWLTTNAIGVATASRLTTSTVTVTAGVNTNLAVTTVGAWATNSIVTNNTVLSRLVYGVPGSGVGRLRAVYLQDPE